VGAPFFGGIGFSLENDWAPAINGQADTAITAIPSSHETFNFFAIMLPPRELKCPVNTKVLKKTVGFYHIELTVINVAASVWLAARNPSLA
jgi:hypothetical protein